MRLGLVVVTAVLLQPAQALADEPQSLAPSSPWNLRYDEDKCRMLRSFGTNEQKVTLMLDQSGAEPYYTLTLVGPGVDATSAQYMTVQFGDEGETKRSFVKGRTADKTELVTMYGLNLAPLLPLEGTDIDGEVEPIGASREAAIDRVALSGGLGDPLVLETGSMGEALAAMRKCSTDLVRHLGLDGPDVAGFSKQATPKGNPGEWLNDGDYPSAMIQREEEGIVRFRLTVSSAGEPTACHIARSSRPQIFDDVVCLALIKRAKFEPALDKDGKPVASYYNNSVRFRMP